MALYQQKNVNFKMHSPRKRFGQHFLCDQAVIARILAALQPQPGDKLIEIGPGQGALTVPLLRQNLNLAVIEIDRDCIVELQMRTKHSPRLQIHAQDVLTLDFNLLMDNNKKPLRVFGNLPYNISTPLLFHLLKFAPIIEDMLFMLQKEVAERLVAKPHTAEYGRLSVMTQYHYAMNLLFAVPRQAFFPPPKVQSSMVHFVPYRTYPYPAHDYGKFSLLVREAFNHRRKTLRNSLKSLVSEEAWTKTGISSKARAEELSVADFVLLANSGLKNS